MPPIALVPTFSEDGYYKEYDPSRLRHVHSVRGWCNYSEHVSSVEDPFDIWVGQRCPGECCIGEKNNKAHTSHQNLVVAVHGSTRGDGTDIASYMGIGVYLGEDNPFNECYFVEFLDKQPFQPATQRAEITAATCALQKIHEIQMSIMKHKINARSHAPVRGVSEPLMRVFVKTDSDYLMKSMNDWLAKRRETKYLTSVGKPITNKDVLETLDSWACLIEKSGCQVVFWCVGIESNADAEDLASEALDRAS